MVGKTLDRYRIECRLGEGGAGVVYRAHDLRLGRTVALKLLHEQLHEAPNAWSQLLSEARIASSLNHPNICTVYEVGEEEGQGYIAMEYVDGKPLHVAVPPGGLPADSIVSLGAQVAEALHLDAVSRMLRTEKGNSSSSGHLFLQHKAEQCFDAGTAARQISH
jgi:eukaryotic-like serine/threonine-protein kinase